MAANEDLSSMKSSFLTEFQCLLSNKHGDNVSYLNNDQYLKFIEEVKEAKTSAKRSTLQYRRLKRFDVCCIGDVEKLIIPVSRSVENTDNLKYYVKNEEMFDVLHEIHVSIGHGGRNRMIVESKKKYANITQDVILLYLRLCKPCQMKQKSTRKGLVVKPILSNELNSRCQVDLIDMQTNPDGPYRFILVYQDHLTKFIQLHALQSKTAEEVSKKLLDIFCTFGSPSILQSDNGREFANKVVESLTQMWPGLKIVHGKPRHSQSQGSVERANQDIEKMLMTWMADEHCQKWSEGLRFVQLMKNRAYHHGIKRSPYQAMFGCDVKVGLRSSNLPAEVIEYIQNEEDLEKFVNETDTDINKENETEGDVIKKTAGKSIDCDLCAGNKNKLCELCKKKQGIDTNRSCAKESLIQQALKMTVTSNEKFAACKVGDTVRVKIPDVDRGRGDFPNVLMAVVECADNGLYKLGNKTGTISELFSRNQFTVCDSKFLDIEDVSPEKKSLRQIANAQSTSGGQGYKRCHCKTKCGTKKCLCKAAGILCNSKCHSSLNCNNK